MDLRTLKFLRPMTDIEKMPFGIHKGKIMTQVPAEYLMYIYHEKWISSWPRLKQYIEQRMTTIKQEINDNKNFNQREEQ